MSAHECSKALIPEPTARRASEVSGLWAAGLLRHWLAARQATSLAPPFDQG
jgi:hypothetical protein